MKRIICLTYLLLALSVTASRAAENTNINESFPRSFNEAEAWNIKVERRFEFPAATGDNEIRYSAPTFSHDFRRLLYIVGESERFAPGASSFSFYGARRAFVVVRSLDNNEIIKRIPLDGSFVQMDEPTIAYSPDEKKVVLGFVTLPDYKGDGLLFVDLESSKVTPVPIDSKDIYRPGKGDLYRIMWPDPTFICLSAHRLKYMPTGRDEDALLGLNLDTLKSFAISTEQYNTSIKNLEFHANKHDKCILELLRIRDRGFDLVVTSQGYAKVILSDYQERVGGPVDGYPPNLSDLDYGAIWSPDLRYILLRPGAHLILFQLGLRSKPELDFELRHLGESLTDTQRQQIKISFSAGKKIWANVYGRKVNPLNDRLLGPDEEFRGQGFLTQIEPKFKFKFTYEKLPAEKGNVVAIFQVGNEWNWNKEVWGELVKVGEGDKSSLGALNVEQQTAGIDSASAAKSANEAKVEEVIQDPARREIVQLIEKAITAKGGRDVLGRFKVSKTVSTATGKVNGKSYTMRGTQIVQLPDRLRVDQEVSFTGKYSTPETFYILGGRSLTMAKPGLGFIPKKMTPESEQRLRQALYLLECASITPLLDPDFQLEKISSPAAQQEHAIAVKVRKAGKPDVILLFDQDSGSLIGIDCNEPTKDGRTVETRSRYSDFRSFSGLVYPTTVKYFEGPNVESTSKNESIEPLESFPEPDAR